MAVEPKAIRLVWALVGVGAVDLVKTRSDQMSGRKLGRLGESLPAVAPQIDHLLYLRRGDEQFTSLAIAKLELAEPASQQSGKAFRDVPDDFLGDHSPRGALRHRSSTPLRSSQVIQRKDSCINIMCD